MDDSIATQTLMDISAVSPRPASISAHIGEILVGFRERREGRSVPYLQYIIVEAVEKSTTGSKGLLSLRESRI